jgi:hypothetical protein
MISTRDDYDEETVEFDDGTKVTVNNNGEVTNVEEKTPEDEFFDALAEQAEFERLNKGSAFFGSNNTGLANGRHGNSVNVYELADEYGVEMRALWKAYEDETELDYYIALE